MGYIIWPCKSVKNRVQGLWRGYTVVYSCTVAQNNITTIPCFVIFNAHVAILCLLERNKECKVCDDSYFQEFTAQGTSQTCVIFHTDTILQFMIKGEKRK